MFIKIDRRNRIIKGIVLEPDFELTAEEIEKMAYNFMKRYPKYKNFVILESFIFEEDSHVDGEAVKAGCWLITAQINDPEKWGLIDSGKVEDFMVTLEET